ncbi:hypothetical protein AgCh_010715 [Apium graveolens]
MPRKQSGQINLKKLHDVLPNETRVVPENQVWPTRVKVWEHERRSPPSQSLGMKGGHDLRASWRNHGSNQRDIDAPFPIREGKEKVGRTQDRSCS